RNDGYDPDYGEHHFGMVTNDFYPKEVYSVYNMLASVFANAHFVKDYKPDTDLWGFCFADGDTLLIPVWNESETGSSKNLIFKTDAKKAAVLDVMGNEKPIPLISGRLCIDASDIPQTLKLEGASEASFEGELLKSNSEDVVIPGRDWTLSLNVINPLDHETPIEISVDNLRGGDCPDGPTRKLTLPADTATSVDFHFIMNKEEAGDSLVTVNYQIPETSWRGVLYLPVKVAGSIPAKDEVGRAPDFAMNRQNQMTSLIAADPRTAHRLWKGPEDLSGEIWLNKSDNFLNVRVVVNDDIHSQPYSGDDLIQGDSLRVYFCPDKTGKIEGVGLSLTDNSMVVKQQFVPDSGKMETVESDSFVGSIHREGHQTLYQLSIPSDFLNRTSDDRDQGVRFNVILDDNDGEGPDSRMHLTGVLPDGTNVESWPLIIFE
ncbi:MAG: hypothetical protein IKW74_05485, partial [Thermoguttaceae bacterium]|nr:hypothetical protein [Thermoguttaceae bacterium]